MLNSIRDYAISLILSLPGLILALTVHEFAHAFVSSKLGDPLPKATGRLTLNPFQHIDPVGLIMLVFLRFGWAKPVMIDPRFYKHKKLDTALTSLAGPAANFVLAFVLVLAELLLNIVYGLLYERLSSFMITAFSVVYTMVDITVILSVGLGLFNLIPISPLDGSKILYSFLPLKAYEKAISAERIGYLVLILLMFNLPGRLLGIVGVPYGITMWLDLSMYLGIARTAIISAFEWVWIAFLGLFGL
ncbi:MAG: site-2 protease family protein [Clostridia bacterium]|nr:site-2 protease family protein [Clostridia bacterium]